MHGRAEPLGFRELLKRGSWGGSRPGAGRKPASKRIPVHHVRRPRVPLGCPSHVTLRIQRGLPSLRSRRFSKVFRRSLRQACERGDFRVVHYSVQRNHVHLLIESASKQALGRGMKAVAARLARAANRVFARSGRVLYGRYHLRVLRTPREVRNALAYVLLNARKHWRERHGTAPPLRLDEASSAAWFDGWKRQVAAPWVQEPPEVAWPHTWLLATGWRRHGLLDPGEVPGR
jgi:REP element-mobilizing transposase RayT